MPNPRTPRLKAAITGADKANPARFASRSDPKGIPLGNAPPWFRGSELVAWEACKRELPWLMESDRIVVEIASGIRARMMDGQEVGIQALNLLRQCAGQMGATPADRSKIVVQSEPEADPTDKFFN